MMALKKSTLHLGDRTTSNHFRPESSAGLAETWLRRQEIKWHEGRARQGVSSLPGRERGQGPACPGTSGKMQMFPTDLGCGQYEQ